MSIVPASISDHQEITLLTKKSKAHWGFSEEQMKRWDKELTIDESYIERHDVFKLVQKRKIIGYYALIKNDLTWTLDNMFILPSEIGKGFGNKLMKHFLSFASNQHMKEISLDAEPKAVEFYAKYGFQVISVYESSIKGRFIKVMIKKL